MEALVYLLIRFQLLRRGKNEDFPDLKRIKEAD